MRVGLSSGATGPEVVRLHRVLEAAGLVIDEREKERQEFGASTLEALLAFQLIVTSLALVVAATIKAAAFCVLAIGFGGWLFWKLVRVMGRIQAGYRR